ncbi:hypothetical protein ACFV0T_41560 [Streptomyces sp. NPDC059582]|uniref:hypothetical protein n=1 Tax=Streptomyces sp. NPDC059582 TaxID=3346875 RepID=UPI0036A0F05C
MRFKEALIGATAGLAITAGVIGTCAGTATASDKSPDTIRTSAGTATARPANAQGVYWKLCDATYMAYCMAQGFYEPPRSADLRKQGMNDKISSLATNAYAIETWNDVNFQGAYGYFKPNFVWNELSYPYNDAISSMSYPEA